jgi:internalin A
MKENNDIRINKALRELNISLERAVEFLKRNRIYIDRNPNSKITDSDYNLLKAQYEEKHVPDSIKDIENICGVILIEKFINRNISVDLFDNYYVLNNEDEIIELNIYEVKISDISFVSRNRKIIDLSLINCGIENINPISSLTGLKKLNLQTNNIGNYQTIKGLINLEEIHIADGTISDFSFFPNQIEILSLKDSNVKNINFLGELIHVRYLDLSYNFIKDITPLKKLLTITDLDLSHNKIENITPLYVFKIFDFLYLNDNQIEDISALRKTQIKHELHLGGNKIIDLSPLYWELKKNRIGFLNVIDNPLMYPPLSLVREDDFIKLQWFESNLEVARQRIYDCKKNNSKILNLGNCGLTDLSMLPELFVGTENIEELIISNHYANYDFNNESWNREESFGIYPNNISNIPNTISKLKSLKILIIGGDWRKGKEWNRWRIKKITNFLKLNRLEVLNISNNQITVLPKLNVLSNLKILQANNNKIRKIEVLDGFESMEELYLSNNEISDVDFLKDLESIITLDLHGNKIKDVSPIKSIINRIGIEDSKWNIHTVNVKDNNLDEAFVNILRNNSKEIKNIELENYFKRLKQGKYISVKRMKLILLGNTRAGKTTLADIMSNGNKSDGKSTHGINFFHIKIGEIDIRGYDFGGQDYYHNTHYSFFDDKAMYIIVWGNSQSNKLEMKNEDILFPLNYWLGSLNSYAYRDMASRFFDFLSIASKSSNYSASTLNKIISNYQIKILNKNILLEDIEVFMRESSLSFKSYKAIINEILNIKDNSEDSYLFNKNDFPFSAYLFQNLNNNKIWLNESQLKDDYGFINDFVTYNFRNDDLEIKAFLNEKLNQFAKETKVLNIDNELAIEFEKNKEKVIIDLDEVRNLKKEITNYTGAELDSLLTSLHSILACYYFRINIETKEKLENLSLKNKLIIDIEQFTSWIYQILDQRNKAVPINEVLASKKENNDYFSKDKEGYFTREQARKWLNDTFAISNLDYILAFMLQNKLIFKMKNHERFFAPNYLSDKQTKTEKLFLNSFPQPLVKYIFKEYFHTSILSEIINEYFDDLLFEENKFRYVLWKNKVLLYESEMIDKLVYLSFQIDKVNSPYISISRFNDTVSDSFILKICSFIESLIKCYDYEKKILSKKGNYIPYDLLEYNNYTEDKHNSNIFTFENIVYRKSDFKMFLSNKDDYPMKKIFISYSKDDLVLVNQFQAHLSTLKRDGLISTWYCTELLAGGKWDADIQNHFEEADIVCFMLSSNLLKTDYIHEYEIKKAFEKQKRCTNFKIVPIILNYCSWITIENNLGDYTALPYTAKPITDFKDRDMAWYIVSECIRIMINSNEQPSGDDWFNKKELPKSVKKIYERIVEGKVDNNY